MSDRRRELVKNWIRAKVHRQEMPPSIPAGLATSLGRGIHSATDPPSDHAKSTTVELVVDNIPLVLELVGQVAMIAGKAPFIAPIAALMSGILKAYKEVKDTDEKRDVLFRCITNLSGDLCSTILRMEAMDHADLIGRLQADMEAYATMLKKASSFITTYDNQPTAIRFAARSQLATKLAALNQELHLFGARFRTNRLIDLALSERANTATLEHVHDMVVEKKLEEWLSPPNMRLKHSETQKLRQEGTGIWLLESARFIQWQDHPGCLWILGPSGAGKSVLSSTIINKLIAETQPFDPERTPPVAFFYFDFKNKEGQAVESALRRIILQLSAQSPNPYKVLDKHYMVSKGQTLPAFQHLHKILEELLLQLGRTYILLDALDECRSTDQKHLLEFISRLRRWTATPLHVLITSQPRRILTDHLTGVSCIELNALSTEQDITLFVSNELSSSDIWAPHAQYITEQIVRKSSGMFRLAACLLVELFRCFYEDELEDTLEKLPDDLFGVYDRFLQAVLPKDFIYVTAILRWLLFSREPLTLEELSDAISFDFFDPEQFKYRPGRRSANAAAILKWLEGLVVLRPTRYGDSEVILAHASVQDYLLSPRFTKFGPDLSSGSLAHIFISRTCITYLLHTSNHHFGNEALSLTHPLANYVAQNWLYHLVRCHDHSLLFSKAMYLLEEGSEQWAGFVHLFQLTGRTWAAPSSPMDLCCREGYSDGVRGLIAKNATVDASALESAVEGGHTEIVNQLLKHGIEVNATGGKALVTASGMGSSEIVCLLLENGADANAGETESDALQAASVEGHTEIIHQLLMHGADVNSTRGFYGTTLQAASSRGHTETVLLLLEHGANANTTSNGIHGSALHAACAGGYTDIVLLLLEHGADRNASAGHHGSALQAASKIGHPDIVGLLLENGADANAGGAYGYALQAAAERGQTEIVDHLLKHGADANATGGTYGTALIAASAGGHTEAVLLLLEHGADANATGNRDGNALETASARGHTEIVRLLLENGANANTTAGSHGCALQAASKMGHTEIVRLLLANGADTNTWTSGFYGNALQAASVWGHTDIVHQLLKHGADVNATGGPRGSPLLAACWKGHTEVVRLLMKNGAKVNTTGGEHGSAVRLRIRWNRAEVLEVLLEYGVVVAEELDDCDSDVGIEWDLDLGIDSESSESEEADSEADSEARADRMA